MKTNIILPIFYYRQLLVWHFLFLLLILFLPFLNIKSKIVYLDNLFEILTMLFNMSLKIKIEKIFWYDDLISC